MTGASGGGSEYGPSMRALMWPSNYCVHQHFPGLTSSRIIPFHWNVLPALPFLRSPNSAVGESSYAPQGSHWYFSVFIVMIIPIPIFVVGQWCNCSASSETTKPLQWLPRTTGWRTALAPSRCTAEKDLFPLLRLFFLRYYWFSPIQKLNLISLSHWLFYCPSVLWAAWW